MHLRAVLAAAALAAASLAVPAASAAPTATLSGRVLSPAGEPVRGALVHFRYDPTLGNRMLEACQQPAQVACVPYVAATRTDAAGRYRLTIRTDRPTGASGTRLVAVTAPTGAQPAQTYVTVGFTRRSLTLPDLRLWAGEVSIDPAGPGRVLRVPPLGAEYGDSTWRAPAGYLAQHGAPVWGYGLTPYALPVDPRTVEAGTTHVYAWHGAVFDGYDITYRSEGRPVTGGVTPLSRGKACYVYGAGDTPLRLAGCRLTDGRLASVVEPRYLAAGGRRCTGCARENSVLIDLGAVRTVGALALRSCRYESVWGSSDGTSFTPLRRVDALDRYEGLMSSMSSLHTYQPAAARYVRVEVADGDCFRLSEISVFAPLP